MNAPVASPFGGNVQSHNLISVEQQRAVAEVQASMIVARSMPRNRQRVLDLILTDCGDPDLAEDASYEYSRGGTAITGPSIRLLETVARRWGNLECGVRELSRGEGSSECEAYAWDLETNFRDSKKFQVRHFRDTKSGGYVVKDERDIYEIVANVGARRKRACMEAVIDRSVINAALRQTEITMKTKIDITPEFIEQLVERFAAFGVTKEMLEARIQRSLQSLTPGLAVQLKRIHTSLKDGMSLPGEWFAQVATAEGAHAEGEKVKPAGGTSALKGAAAKANAKKKEENKPPEEPPVGARQGEPDGQAAKIDAEVKKEAAAQVDSKSAIGGTMRAIIDIHGKPVVDDDGIQCATGRTDLDGGVIIPLFGMFDGVVIASQEDKVIVKVQQRLAQ